MPRKGHQDIQEETVLLVDRQRPEYRNIEVRRRVLTKYGIHLYHTENEEKACIAERVIRTINSKLRLLFEVNKNRHWITLLPTLVKQYNEKDCHRTIGTTPAEASKKTNEEAIFNRAYGGIVPCDFHFKGPKYRVGERVRITMKKKIFQNKYKGSNWSREIFVITGIRYIDPLTYVIKDLKGERIIGSFYENELQPTRY